MTDTSSETATILHAFADFGMECMVLASQGTVTRATIDPEPNPWDDEVIQADLLEETIDGTYDLGLFHPVCSKWAGPTGITGDRDDHPNMIPRARELAEELCDEWIIENVPGAPLEDAVVLDGRAFGLPIQYRRAFETSFEMREPPRYSPLGSPETSPHYHSERSKEWWAAVKGYPVDAASKEHVAKNCLPTAYVRYLLTSWLEATGRAEGPGRNYDGYHDEMEEKRRRAENQDLTVFADGGPSE